MKSRQRHDRGWETWSLIREQRPASLWPEVLWNILATALLAATLFVALRVGLARQDIHNDQAAQDRERVAAHRAATLEHSALAER